MSKGIVHYRNQIDAIAAAIAQTSKALIFQQIFPTHSARDIGPIGFARAAINEQPAFIFGHVEIINGDNRFVAWTRACDAAITQPCAIIAADRIGGGTNKRTLYQSAFAGVAGFQQRSQNTTGRCNAGNMVTCCRAQRCGGCAFRCHNPAKARFGVKSRRVKARLVGFVALKPEACDAGINQFRIDFGQRVEIQTLLL